MKKWLRRIGIVLLLFLAVVGFLKIFKGAVSFEKGIGILQMEGAFWISEEWVEEIEAFRKNSQIAGVVVRIQSPGGTVAASQEIFEALKRLKAVKPVVASMGTIAASGGLYIAMAADTIVADPGTLTGSIGVRMQHLNLEELFKFAKIRYETIKSGRLKDLASISRSMTEEERGLLEEMMTEIHDQFKTAVAESRKLKLSEVEKFADGRIFTGAKAKELGLVDVIGDMGKAIEIVKEKTGLKGEPKLIYSKESGPWWIKAFLESAKVYFSGPLACYLYP